MTLAEILLSVFYQLSVLSQVFSVLQVTKTIDTGHFNAEREIRLETLKWTCLKTLKVDDSFVKTKFSVEKKNYNTDPSQSFLDRLSIKMRRNSVKVVC